VIKEMNRKIKALFCWHDYETVTRVFSGFCDVKGRSLSVFFAKKTCKKCGKVKFDIPL